jgi:hypothetical protein
MNILPTKLSPPSTKTPLTDADKNTLNHIWQRWFSDLYLYLVGQESAIAGSGGSIAGPQGPPGAQGIQGIQGVPGIPGATGPEGPVSDILADGGFANSVYIPIQLLDGGDANG